MIFAGEQCACGEEWHADISFFRQVMDCMGNGKEYTHISLRYFSMLFLVLLCHVARCTGKNFFSHHRIFSSGSDKNDSSVFGMFSFNSLNFSSLLFFGYVNVGRLPIPFVCLFFCFFVCVITGHRIERSVMLPVVIVITIACIRTCLYGPCLL